MDTAIWVAIINSAAMVANAYFLYGLHQKVAVVQEDIHTVEKATNSLTDRLVASTAKENFAAGSKEGHAEGVAEGKAAPSPGMPL